MVNMALSDTEVVVLLMFR